MTAPIPHHLFAIPMRLSYRQWQLRLFASVMAMGVVGLVCSSQRIVIAPGMEIYLGPFFYLLAYWLFGVRIGMGVAALTMLPTYFWWGHPVSIGLAVAHVAFLHWTAPRYSSFAIRSLLFFATFGAVAGYALVLWNYAVEPSLATVIVLRKLLIDVFFAAVIDVFRLLFQVDRACFRISIRHCVRLSAAVTTSTMLFAVSMGMALFILEAQHFDERFRGIIEDTVMQVRLLAAQEASLPIQREQRQVATLMGSVSVLIAPSRSELGSTASISAALGCSRFDDGRDVSGPNDRSTFAYWINACRIGEVGSSGHKLVYAASIRTLALEAYRELLHKLLGVLALAALGLLSMRWLRRLTHRTMITWFDVVRDFGTPGLSVPPPVPLKDFQPAIDAFVHENNTYVALMQEREQLAEAVAELKNAIDLTLAESIRFDSRSGELVFRQLGSSGREVRRIRVHEGDRQEFVSASGRVEAMVEFRPADKALDEWYMLIARDPEPHGRWKAGCVLRLRQSKVEQDRMLHQGRLMDLGGMASALSHEIKQPLFTIALAAENAMFQVEASGNVALEPVIRKLERIGEQVDRARSIIDQVGHYARLETPEGEVFDAIEAVTASASFVRPMLVADEMTLSIAHDPGERFQVSMARVGLEQIVVNALQNAHDSILTRRHGGDLRPGRIAIGLRKDEGMVHVTIADNGTGLSDQVSGKAFEAFFTTKGPHRGTGLGLYICRQIIMEAGGLLRLDNRPEGGAILTITVPCEVDAANELIGAIT